MEYSVLAEELLVIDGDSPLWAAARPFLNVALRLEQNDDSYSWHGWHKQQVEQFLKKLPAECSLVVGVWETVSAEGAELEHESLILGVACEVVEGEVCSIRTFEVLTRAGLKPSQQLEPGIDETMEVLSRRENCWVRSRGRVVVFSWAAKVLSITISNIVQGKICKRKHH